MASWARHIKDVPHAYCITLQTEEPQFTHYYGQAERNRALVSGQLPQKGLLLVLLMFQAKFILRLKVIYSNLTCLPQNGYDEGVQLNSFSPVCLLVFFWGLRLMERLQGLCWILIMHLLFKLWINSCLKRIRHLCWLCVLANFCYERPLAGMIAACWGLLRHVYCLRFLPFPQFSLSCSSL